MNQANLINWLNPRAPKGLIVSAAQWVQRRVVEQPQLRGPRAAAWVKEIFPAEDNFNLLPYPTGLTPGEEFSSVRWTSTPPASLFYLQGCRLLGAEGAIISPENSLFAEFTLPPVDEWREHSCFRRRRIPAVKPLKGWYATITWPESRFFFHWMVEALPRMAVLGAFAKVLDGLFVPSPLERYHKESLRALGIDAAKLIPLDVHSHYAPEHLFVPRAFAMYNPPRWLAPWYKSVYLDSRAATAVGAFSKRIYISRGDAPARRVANESEVVDLLERRGFEPVQLSAHSFEEQARIFNQAGIVVAPHGAGLSHIVFCEPNAAIVDIMPPRWMAPCFMALASSVGCRYRHLVAEEVPTQAPPDAQRDDIGVPIAELEQLVEELIR
jgi:hypothetical protein